MWVKIGICHFKLKNNRKATPNLLKGVKHAPNPSHERIEGLFYLSVCFYLRMQYRKFYYYARLLLEEDIYGSYTEFLKARLNKKGDKKRYRILFEDGDQQWPAEHLNNLKPSLETLTFAKRVIKYCLRRHETMLKKAVLIRRHLLDVLSKR